MHEYIVADRDQQIIYPAELGAFNVKILIFLRTVRIKVYSVGKEADGAFIIGERDAVEVLDYLRLVFTGI